MSFVLAAQRRRERKAAVWSLCLPLDVDAKVAAMAKKANMSKSAVVRKMIEHCIREAA